MKKIMQDATALIRGFDYFKGIRWKYFLGLLFASFELIILFVTPILSQQMINTITDSSDINLVWPVVSLFLLMMATIPFVILGKYLQNITAEKAIINLRETLFHKIQRLSYATFTKYKTGDYITRLVNDASISGSIFSSYAIVSLVRFVIVFTVSFILLARTDGAVLLFSLGYSIVCFILSVLLNPYVKRLERDAKQQIVHSSSYLIEAVQAASTIRIYTLQDILKEKYQKVCTVIREKRIRFRFINGIAYGAVDFFAFSAQTVGFIFIVLLSYQRMGLGDSVFLASVVGLMSDSMLRFSSFLLLIQPKLVAIHRVFEILDLPEEEQEAREEQTLDLNYPFAIECSQLSFAYEGQNPVIQSLNLNVQRGENLAIVGGSGGGKSTLLKLLLAFYPPSAGSISYFGEDGKKLGPFAAREMIAYVPQECTLFDGTIAENIALAKPNATPEEIAEAAKAADIHNFILSLPEQYQSQVGERGTQLSGGQKQRIAIARALLKNAPIIILDEVTAALDFEAEQEIMACLDQITQGQKTVITIAHRLSTIKNANRILVMQSGQIAEEGKFEELINRRGIFYELYKAQFSENVKKRD